MGLYPEVIPELSRISHGSPTNGNIPGGRSIERLNCNPKEYVLDIKKTLTAAATASMLVASPVLAQAQADRATAPADESEQVFGGNILLTALIIGGVIVGIILLADDDDVPVSP